MPPKRKHSEEEEEEDVMYVNVHAFPVSMWCINVIFTYWGEGRKKSEGREARLRGILITRKMTISTNNRPRRRVKQKRGRASRRGAKRPPTSRKRRREEPRKR
jgi:hypothetical protein